MKSELKSGNIFIIVGLLFFLLSIIDYIRTTTFLISPISILSIDMGIICIVTGIFEFKKSDNKMMYLILIFVIYFIAIFVFVKIVAFNLLYYLLTLIFTVIVLSLAYQITQRMDKYSLLTNYNKALKINPYDAITWNNKGTFFVELGNYTEAIGCFNKSIEIEPKNAIAWHNKGVSFDKLRRHREALEYYDKALKLDPKFKIAKKTGKSF